MPSFFVELHVLRMHPGHQPAEAVEVAASASILPVEAKDVAVVAGVGVVRVRVAVPSASVVEEESAAWECARLIRAAVTNIATTGTLQVRRTKQRRYRSVPALHRLTGTGR